MSSNTTRGIGKGLMLALFAGGLLVAWAFDAWRSGEPAPRSDVAVEPNVRAVAPDVVQRESIAPAVDPQDALEIDAPLERATDARIIADPPREPIAPPVPYEERIRQQMLRVAATPDAVPTEEEREAYVRYMEEKMAEVAEQQRREDAAKEAARSATESYRGREAYENYLGIDPGDGGAEGDPNAPEDATNPAYDAEQGTFVDPSGETELVD